MGEAATTRGVMGAAWGGREAGVWMWLVGGTGWEEVEGGVEEEDAFSWSMAARWEKAEEQREGKG